MAKSSTVKTVGVDDALRRLAMRDTVWVSKATADKLARLLQQIHPKLFVRTKTKAAGGRTIYEVALVTSSRAAEKALVTVAKRAAKKITFDPPRVAPTKNPKETAGWLEYEKTSALAELDRAAVAGGVDPEDLEELRARVKQINKELAQKVKTGPRRVKAGPKRNPAPKKAPDVLGKPDVVPGMKFGTRYKYSHGIFIDHVADKGEYHVSQAGRPSKKLGVAKSLAGAQKIARQKGDFTRALPKLPKPVKAPKTPKAAKPVKAPKRAPRRNPEPSTAIVPVEPVTPPKKLTKRMMQPVTRQFSDLVKVAAKDMPPVKYTRLVADPTVHTTPRAYGMAGIEDGWPVIKVAPELADQPASVILGVLAHEIGHILIMLGREAMRSGYDSSERQADEVAEAVFGKKIFYNENGVQCAGRGARGKRPRPRGLR